MLCKQRGAANLIGAVAPFINETWSSAVDVVGTAPGGTVLWVGLFARPGSNEIGLLFSDDASRLFSVKWNGNSWGTVRLLSTTLRSMDHRSFDGAYESVTGDFLAAWAVVQMWVSLRLTVPWVEILSPTTQPIPIPTMIPHTF